MSVRGCLRRLQCAAVSHVFGEPPRSASGIPRPAGAPAGRSGTVRHRVLRNAVPAPAQRARPSVEVCSPPMASTSCSSPPLFVVDQRGGRDRRDRLRWAPPRVGAGRPTSVPRPLFSLRREQNAVDRVDDAVRRRHIGREDLRLVDVVGAARR